jgi:hypothetical protein
MSAVGIFKNISHNNANMSSGAFKVRFKPMNGCVQIRPTPTVKAVSAPLLIFDVIRIKIDDNVFYATTARKKAKVFNFNNAVSAQMFLEKCGDKSFKEYVL